jgi:dienelactone hydrolase
MGFCIGGPFIWNLLRRAPDRVVAAVLAQPSGYRPEMPNLFYENNIRGWAPGAAGPATRHHARDDRRVPEQDVSDRSRFRLHGPRAISCATAKRPSSFCWTTFRRIPMPSRWNPRVSRRTRR